VNDLVAISYRNNGGFWQWCQHTKQRLEQSFWYRSINELMAMIVVETAVAFVPMQQAMITTVTSNKSLVREATRATT